MCNMFEPGEEPPARNPLDDRYRVHTATLVGDYTPTPYIVVSKVDDTYISYYMVNGKCKEELSVAYGYPPSRDEVIQCMGLPEDIEIRGAYE
jgi:hypothetical protein